MLRRQTEMAVKGVLCIEVDAPVLEVGVELLLCFPVLGIESVDVVVGQVERFDVPFGLNDACLPVLDGMVQQSVADKIDQTGATSRSGFMPSWYSAKRCGCSLMNEMML